jgi:lipoprotein-releasing system permease protein
MQKDSLSLYFIQKLILSPRSGALVKRITILSFIAISLSLTAFLIVLFVMNGMNLNIKKRIMALEPHLVTLNESKDDDMIEKIIPSQSSQTYEAFDLILRTIDGQFRGAQAVGYTEKGLQQWMERLSVLKKKEGKVQSYDLDADSFSLEQNEVALGVDLARSLGILEGDEITLIPPETLLLSSLETPLFQKVIVKRILVTDLYDLDSKLILFNSQKSLAMFSKTLSRKRGTHLWFSSISDAEYAEEKLLKVGVKSETWQEKNSDLFFALMMEKTMIGIFLGLAGLIASSSILTVLALLMSQKKRDIAIIKTLGLSQQKTLWLFTKIGLWISGSAIALGIVIGLCVSTYLQFFPVNILPNIYYDSSIPALVDFGFVFIVIIVSGGLAFLGSYFPAKATLEIQPALLLRQKN